MRSAYANPQHFDAIFGWYGEIDPIDFDALCKKWRALHGPPHHGQRWSLLDKSAAVGDLYWFGGSVTREALKTQADCYIMGEAIHAPESSGFPAVIEPATHSDGWRAADPTLLEPDGIDVDVPRIPSIASMAKSTALPRTSGTGFLSEFCSELGEP